MAIDACVNGSLASWAFLAEESREGEKQSRGVGITCILCHLSLINVLKNLLHNVLAIWSV